MTNFFTLAWPEISKKVKSEFQLLTSLIFSKVSSSQIIESFMTVFDKLSNEKYNSPKILSLNDNALEFLIKLLTETENPEK